MFFYLLLQPQNLCCDVYLARAWKNSFHFYFLAISSASLIYAVYCLSVECGSTCSLLFSLEFEVSVKTETERFSFNILLEECVLSRIRCDWIWLSKSVVLMTYDNKSYHLWASWKIRNKIFIILFICIYFRLHVNMALKCGLDNKTRLFTTKNFKKFRKKSY